MKIEQLEHNVVEAAIAKYQSPLGSEVRSDGKEYLLSTDVEELGRRADALNQAIRDLIAARSALAETVDWPEIIDG